MWDEVGVKEVGSERGYHIFYIKEVGGAGGRRGRI